MRGDRDGRRVRRGTDMRFLWQTDQRSLRWFEGSAGAAQAARQGDGTKGRDRASFRVPREADSQGDEAVIFRYFGRWRPDGGGVRFPTPIGVNCSLCKEVIDVGDCGVFALMDGKLLPHHRECGFRAVMGGIGHFLDHQLWCQVIEDPDGGRSYRESALEVWEWIRQQPISGIEGMG